MKKKIALLTSILTIFSTSFTKAASLDYDEYYTTANIEVGIDFSKFRIYDGSDFIPVTQSMVTNYDPNKIGRQLVTISKDEFDFKVPIFLTQKPSVYMNSDGYIDLGTGNINTTGLTDTSPNTVITLDEVTTGSAIVPCYTGADGREYKCYLYKNTSSGFKLWGNQYLNYYTKEINIPLSDIYDAWYTDVCTKMYISEIMSGTSNTTFEPTSLMTRAQACQILYKLAGRPSNTYDGRYKDVKRTDWYANSIYWYYSEIMNKDKQYVNPNFYISRDEVAFMIANCLDKSMSNSNTSLPPTFKDINECEHPDSVLLLQQLEIIYGNNDMTFKPNEFITRAEFATIINNYINVYIDGRS